MTGSGWVPRGAQGPLCARRLSSVSRSASGCDLSGSTEAGSPQDGWEPVHLPAPRLGQERLLLKDRRPHQLAWKWGEPQRRLTPLRRSLRGPLVGQRCGLFLTVAWVSDGLYPTVGTSPAGRRPGGWSWQERAGQLRPGQADKRGAASASG